MMIRFALFGLMALGLLGFGTVAWVSAHPPAPHHVQAAPPARLKVLAVARDVLAGSLLRAEDLAVKDVPRDAVPHGAVIDSAAARRALVGGMLRRGVAKGDVLLSAEVMRPGDHGFLASVLSPGMRAVTVGVDAVSGTAGLISPGDRVDVILVQTLQGADLPAGRRVAAQTVLTDVRVIAIDQALVRGAAGHGTDAQARTVTLEVTGDQAERLEVAGRIGRLSLAVRAANQPRTAARTLPPPPVYAGDVSSALPVVATHPDAGGVLRVFQGAEAKEFRF